MKKFSSTLDGLSILISGFMGVAILSVFVTAYISYKKTGGQPAVFIFTIAAGILLAVLVAALYVLRTKEIAVDDTGITIERGTNPVFVSFNDIKEIKIISRPERGIVFRTFGNGGIFGYTGRYYSKKLGNMTWYCTNRKKYVLIAKKDGRNLVISPDDANGFLQATYLAMPGLRA